MTSSRPEGGPPRSAVSCAAASIAAMEALASLDPRPYNRPSSITGANGSRVQPSPGGTTSRWVMRASVGPVRFPRTSTLTPVASRTTSSPAARADCSANCATASSSPLTDGMATRSRSSWTSVELGLKLHRLLATDDHRAAPDAREHLEQQRVGGPSVDDVRPLHAVRRGPDARLDLGPHPAH